MANSQVKLEFSLLGFADGQKPENPEEAPWINRDSYKLYSLVKYTYILNPGIKPVAPADLEVRGKYTAATTPLIPRFNHKL